MASLKENTVFSMIRFIGLSSAFLALVYVINNFIIFNFGAAGFLHTLNLGSFSGVEVPKTGFNEQANIFGILQTSIIFGIIGYSAYRALSTSKLREDANLLDWISAYIIRAAFWAVLIVGLTDAVLSFLRVEGFHKVLFGENAGAAIALPSARGLYVHVPLMILAALIALRDKSVSLVWLALLVVIAEFLIVIARFIYGYEQTFMGDLVRFWYAALFLFASAYTLYEEGHVRVDVIYAGLSDKVKAYVNAWGSYLLGVLTMIVVVLIGFNGKTSIINSPLLVFEITNQGINGLFIKYQMAMFLGIFGATMLVQFVVQFFESLADINEEPGKRDTSIKLVS